MQNGNFQSDSDSVTSVTEIIAKLKASKQQGLTFYQATEQLKQQGYTPAQIADAAAQFNYAKFDPNSAAAPVTKPDSAAVYPTPTKDGATDDHYQRLGNALLADKERGSRPFFSFFCVVLGAAAAVFIYRTWLSVRYFSSHNDKQFIEINNLAGLVIAGALGAIIALVILKLYYRSKDKKYKDIDQKHQ